MDRARKSPFALHLMMLSRCKQTLTGKVSINSILELPPTILEILQFPFFQSRSTFLKNTIFKPASRPDRAGAIFLFSRTNPRGHTEAGWGNSLVPFNALTVSIRIVLMSSGNPTKMADMCCTSAALEMYDHGNILSAHNSCQWLIQSY